jgi:hypothetical protein
LPEKRRGSADMPKKLFSGQNGSKEHFGKEILPQDTFQTYDEL